MRHLIFQALFIIFSIPSFSQFHFINLEVGEENCPATNSTYPTYTNWDVYQTTDDTYQGTPIENCAPLNNQDLDISSFEVLKPIFYVSDSDLNLELEPNTMYNFAGSVRANPSVLCDCSSSCNSTLCDEFTIFIEGTLDGAITFDTITLSNSLSNNFFGEKNQFTEACWVSSKLENQKITKIIFRVTPEEIFPDAYLKFNNIFIRNMDDESFFIGENTFINKVISNDNLTNVSYIVRPTFFLEELVFDPTFGHVKVLHDLPGLASKENARYYDLIPEDSTNQKIINIINTEFSQLAFQDFTYLRGGLVSIAGNDTLRHRLNIVNDGADLCLPPFIEMPFASEDAFIFKSGTLNFGNEATCLQFKEKAKLIVAENAHLDYGNRGHGLLAFKPGGSIFLEEKASMHFDGHLIILGNNEKPISVSLKEGNKLSFGQDASIKAYQNEAVLTIYMEGGILDINDMDPQYYPNLNIVYPDQNTEKSSILLYPNPTSESLNIQSIERCTDCSFTIYSSQGQAVTNEILLGKSSQVIDLASFEKGIYFLRVSNGEVLKFIKG